MRPAQRSEPYRGTPGRGPGRLGDRSGRGRLLEGGLEFFEAGSEDSAAMQIFEIPLATESVDPFANGSGHLAEPGVEYVEDRLAGGLDDAFLEPFLAGEFFEEGDVGHGFVG